MNSRSDLERALALLVLMSDDPRADVAYLAWLAEDEELLTPLEAAAWHLMAHDVAEGPIGFETDLLEQLRASVAASSPDLPALRRCVLLAYANGDIGHGRQPATATISLLDAIQARTASTNADTKSQAPPI